MHVDKSECCDDLATTRLLAERDRALAENERLKKLNQWLESRIATLEGQLLSVVEGQIADENC